jgi:hypothetical protein
MLPLVAARTNHHAVRWKRSFKIRRSPRFIGCTRCGAPPAKISTSELGSAHAPRHCKAIPDKEYTSTGHPSMARRIRPPGRQGNVHACPRTSTPVPSTPSNSDAGNSGLQSCDFSRTNWQQHGTTRADRTCPGLVNVTTGVAPLCHRVPFIRDRIYCLELWRGEQLVAAFSRRGQVRFYGASIHARTRARKHTYARTQTHMYLCQPACMCGNKNSSQYRASRGMEGSTRFRSNGATRWRSVHGMKQRSIEARREFTTRRERGDALGG